VQAELKAVEYEIVVKVEALEVECFELIVGIDVVDQKKEHSEHLFPQKLLGLV